MKYIRREFVLAVCPFCLDEYERDERRTVCYFLQGYGWVHCRERIDDELEHVPYDTCETHRETGGP